MAKDQVFAAWWVSEERDRRDNRIVYSYDNRHEAGDGHTIEIVPARIEYAHRADDAPLRAIRFVSTPLSPPSSARSTRTRP
ncbi:MAG: hypothetical protein QM820_04695 [Minicystis sp.]